MGNQTRRDFRSYLHSIDVKLSRSASGDRYRDLIAQASIALWDADWKRFVSCALRIGDPKLTEMTLDAFAVKKVLTEIAD